MYDSKLKSLYLHRCAFPNYLFFVCLVCQEHPAQHIFFVFPNAMNHIGGLLISPDSCDNQKLWCKKPCNFICGDHFLYERCCEMQFLPDPFLSVSIFFSFSLSPAWSWAGGMSVMHTLAGRMHSCKAQHPVPFVSTSSTSLKLCGTYAAPGFTPPSSFIPFLWASSIFQNLQLLQSGKCYFSQPTTLPNHEPSAHDDAQVPLHTWLRASDIREQITWQDSTQFDSVQTQPRCLG